MNSDAGLSVAAVEQIATFYREVGSRIRAAREHKELSQEKIASCVGLSRTSLTNIERGKQKFLLHTFVGIAATLGVPPVNLLPVAENNLLRINLRFSSKSKPVEREFVERALNPMIQHEPTSPSPHLSQGKKLAGRTENRHASRRR